MSSAGRGIRWVSLMPGCGYGDAAALYLSGLDRLGVPISWTPISRGLETVGARDRLPGSSPVVDERMVDLWQKPIVADTLVIDVPPPKLHKHWLAKYPDLTPYAYVAWEMDRLPRGWARVLNRFESIFVPSEFNRSVMRECGIDRPIDVIPHIARRVEPVATPRLLSTLADDDFVFYTIGTWTDRKAMAETVRAYLETFRGDERVVLVVKTDSVDRTQRSGSSVWRRNSSASRSRMVWWTLARLLAEYPGAGRVHLVAGEVSPRTIDGIHSRGDCFLSLTRSEGWGLGPFEALLFGNPAIVTGWGGQMDYLGSDYPLALRYQLEDAPADEYDRGVPAPRWARADRGHAGELLRWVFEHRAEARADADSLRRSLSTTYSADAVCRELARGLGFPTGTLTDGNPPISWDRYQPVSVDAAVDDLMDACSKYLAGERAKVTRVWKGDPKRIAELASAHRLQPLLSSLVRSGRLEQNLPQDLLDDWFGAYCLTALRNGRLLQVLGELTARCHAAGLRPLALKGPVDIARGYRDPGLRPMVDLDILCRALEVEPVLGHCYDLGFRYKRQTTPFHVELCHPDNDATVEVHFDLWEEVANRERFLEELWRDAESCEVAGVCFEAPSAACSLVLGVAHLVHHDFLIGMKPILDFALLLTKSPATDGDRVLSMARLGDLHKELGSLSRALIRDLAWSSTEPPWLESGLIAGEEGLDRTLAIQLLAHWRRLPEWAGPGAFDEIATRPGLVGKLGFARRVLLPPPREFRLASRERGAAGARLKHVAAAVAAVVDAALHRSWRARRRGGSLKRELHHRRAARRE